MMTHRFIYEARLAFSCETNRLQVHTSEVDHDGFDVILDDGDRLRKLQLKTTVSASGSWNIHRKLLLPDIRSAEVFRYECSPSGTGLEGGVVLMQLIVKDERHIDVVYHYTDVRILCAFELGALKYNHATKQKAVLDAVADIKNFRAEADRIEIPYAAFVKAKGIAELLSLAGFHCGPSHHAWENMLRSVSSPDQTRFQATNLTEAKAKQFIHEEMLAAISDPWLDTQDA